MTTLEIIKSKNPDLDIMSINDDSFSAYGSILQGYDISELKQYIEENFNIPQSGNSYLPSLDVLSDFSVIKKLADDVYGGLAVQVGIVAGHNQVCNGLECHQGSETIVAITDCVLFLGRRQDVINHTYSSEKADVFLLRVGDVIELYGTTLHYTPCKTVHEGFMAAVLLLDGTNSPLIKHGSGVLFKKNKWFITHTSEKEKIKNGAFPGLTGRLLKVHI